MRALRPAHARGFSIVELMVSIVIGMLALVFATRMLLVSESNKDMSLGASDSMQNGLQALQAMKKDLEQAGFGLNDPLINGCDTVFSDADGFTLATATRGGVDTTPLTAVVINTNAGGSDVISVYAGTSLSGTGSVGIALDSDGGSFTADRLPYGFARGDVVVAVPESDDDDRQCLLAQITEDPGATVDIVTGGDSRYNGAGAVEFTGGSSRLLNLGPAAGLAFHQWSVAGGFLNLRATNLPGSTEQPQGAVVIDNIVAIKAQYGFDTRPANAFVQASGMQATGMRVARWSNTMIDADGDGTVGSHDDWARVAAVRLAIVARGRNVQQVKGSASCDATTVAPELFGTEEPQGVDPVAVTPVLAVADDPVDWKCYRYRKFETIVPIRNSGWRPTPYRPQ
ncbi:PilW family protein [Massilia sp. PAMC28688]|nr:PilW family protein [Massilia sp. PAMC28688]